MKTVSRLKKSEIYISADEVMERYGISRWTLNRWIKERDFPEPRKIVGKRHFLLESVDAWDCEQAGVDREFEGEKALGLPVVSPVIRDYDELVDALIQRREQIEMTCGEVDARSGMQEGYTNKLENWRTDYGRGAGPETLPLWIGALRVGIVFVDIPKRMRRSQK